MPHASMDKALVRLTNVLVKAPARDDDAVDRLHSNASLILLVSFATGTILMAFVGDPIDCLQPTTFQHDYSTQHVNSYCWTHPLHYPLSRDEELLKSHRVAVNFGTAFYRWVTFIFVLQAILFKVPGVVWSRLSRQSGASLTKLRDLLQEAQLNREERHTKMDEAARYLDTWLMAQRTPEPRKMFGRDIGKLACLLQGCGRRSGKYMCVVYLCVKLLYLLNVVGNFVLLAVFVDTGFWRYGLTILNQVIVNGDWHDPVNFPRILLCNLWLYNGGEQRNVDTTNDSLKLSEDSKIYTVQCVLNINSILEKMFALQWFWLVLLAILTAATFVTWSAYTICPCAPYFFARKYMKSSMYQSYPESGQNFVRNYLREDGIFVLQMVEGNTHPMMVAELVQHLWDNFRAKNSAFNMEMIELTDDVTTKDGGKGCIIQPEADTKQKDGAIFVI